MSHVNANDRVTAESNEADTVLFYCTTGTETLPGDRHLFGMRLSHPGKSTSGVMERAHCYVR